MLLFPVFLLSIIRASIVSVVKIKTQSTENEVKVGDNLVKAAVAGTSRLSFIIDSVEGAEWLQKNLVLRCGETYSYHDFVCESSGKCEATVGEGKALSTGTKECKAVLLFATKPTSSSAVQTQKWEIGDFIFNRVTAPAAGKKMPDQKEDRFKSLPEIKPVFTGEHIPVVQTIHYLFGAVLLACWLVFPFLGHRISSSTFLSPLNTLPSLARSSRIALFMLAMLGFEGFCILSWSQLNIFQTLQYAPGVLLVLFATGLSALRHIHSLSNAQKTD